MRRNAGGVGEQRNFFEPRFKGFVGADLVADRLEGGRESAEGDLPSRFTGPNGVWGISLRPPPLARVVRGPGDAVVLAIGRTRDSKWRSSQSRKERQKVLAHTRPFSRPHRSQASTWASTL